MVQSAVDFLPRVGLSRLHNEAEKALAGEGMRKDLRRTINESSRRRGKSDRTRFLAETQECKKRGTQKDKWSENMLRPAMM